ncbi:MAG: Rv3235 family protein [Propionibacteriaceae bacterium]|nr:Rv3235 family protein [Propionibacteriaceae bacterium]
MTLITLPAPPTRPELHLVADLLRPLPAHQLPLPDVQETVVSCIPTDLDHDTERSVRVLTRAVVEALVGRRPLTQVAPALTPRVSRLVGHVARSGVGRGLGLAGLRVQCPAEHVIEVMARLASAERSAAIALRLEHRRHRWFVVSLEAALAPEGRVPARS